MTEVEIHVVAYEGPPQKCKRCGNGEAAFLVTTAGRPKGDLTVCSCTTCLLELAAAPSFRIKGMVIK